MIFNIGDKVRYKNNGEHEIIVDIRYDGYILGRYPSGAESRVYCNSDKYTLIRSKNEWKGKKRG